MKRAIKSVLQLAAGIAAAMCVIYIFMHLTIRTKLQKLESPDGTHRAELIRSDAIDRNYTVRVDGKTVYRSPDFSPRRDISFRETLAWDVTGRFIVLEVARHRVFGFDTSTMQRLTPEQLLSLELAPDSPLWQYGFEAEWPGIGRARRPDVSAP
jgi:hypothetical protein